MKANILEEIASIQILDEFEGQGVFLRFLLLLFLDIVIIILKYDLDHQGVRELVNCNKLRGRVVGDFSLETVLGPIVGRLSQFEDPTLDAPDGSSRGDRDIILKDRLLRQFYGEEVCPQLETGPDGAKVRPGRKVRGLDS